MQTRRQRTTKSTKKGIVDFLYSPADCARIRELYKDEDSRPLLQQQIGQKILEKRSKFINGNAIDILAMICLNSPFAESDSECLAVSVFVCRGVRNPDPLPLITENSGLDLASKSLVSLSLFKPALVKRWQQHAAPHPEYYRKVSKVIFCKNGHDSLARNHQHWEEFLFERLV